MGDRRAEDLAENRVKEENMVNGVESGGWGVGSAVGVVRG